MSSIQHFSVDDLISDNPIFSSFRSIIETAFYGNNVTPVSSISEAYELAYQSPGTIVTDIPIHQTAELHLPPESKVLVFNDGQIVGRTAAARKIIGQPTIDATYYSGILREAIFNSRNQSFYQGNVVVGLASAFMIAAHLLIPAGFENNLYSYLLNFQLMDALQSETYQQSQAYDEGDLFIYSDPEWSHPDFPYGLTLFDPEHNVAAVLGLRYFGELKKATLTLAWAVAHRNGFVACHGGMKQYILPQSQHTMAVFGLSGSGKSTITLSNHHNQQETKILHDDAFIISKTNGSSIALEPSYFDKTQDYPMKDDSIKYFLTCQNVGVTLNNNNEKVLLTEDIRNNNGRAIKSHFTVPNRLNHFNQAIDSICWIMKDESLPPVLKIKDPILATVFGLTLATKRTSAENIVSGIDKDALVIEPFANPFRCYPLSEDYEDFKALFNKENMACYLLNTGYFNGQKVTPEITLNSIETIVNETSQFEPFGTFEDISFLPIEGFLPDFSNPTYLELLKNSFENRLLFLKEMDFLMDGYNSLPKETVDTIQSLINELN
ncbi:MAG: phosphoenolpyruvate carboxykinase (ATP) [Vagococcus sp.]